MSRLKLIALASFLSALSACTPAAAGVPTPEASAGTADAPAPGVALSAVAETVADNYTACHATAAQLTALQDHVRLIEGQGP